MYVVSYILGCKIPFLHKLIKIDNKCVYECSYEYF